jgi:hypothetical protein
VPASDRRPLSQAAAGLADDKFPVKGRMALGPLVVEYELDGHSGHLLDRLGHHGEGWPGELRLLGAVEGDDRKVLGHAQAAFMRSSQQADGLQVRARKMAVGGVDEPNRRCPPS